MQTQKICMINQKGGCGKSSTCFHVAGHFAKTGKRVLLVDVDPQGSLSQGFMGSTSTERTESKNTIAALFDHRYFLNSIEGLAVDTAFDRIDLIIANQHLSRFNTPEPENSGMLQFALASVFDNVTEYDLILFDCPPNLYLCSWNAMLASDYVVVPLPPEDFGTQGLRAVAQAIERAQILNPRLTQLGKVVTRYDRRLVLHRTYERKLRAIYESSVFETTIPEATAFKVALARRQPVPYYNSRCKATLQIAAFGNEMIRRCRSNQESPPKVA